MLGPLVCSEGSASYGVLISLQFHLIFVRIEVVYGVFCSVERLDLRHSELFQKGEVQHPGGEWRFDLLYQGVHGDWSSALYCFLHVADFLLDVPEPLLPRPLLIAILSGGLVRIMLPGRLVSPFMSASRRWSRCCSSRVTGFWSFRACRISWGHRICLVSFSNSFSKCWLVTGSASTSSVLACTVFNAPPGGRLSTPPGWSCILGGLVLLLLVFRVDTISR